MIKNVKSVKIPNSNGLIGIEAACVMGAIAGDASKELMVISNVKENDIKNVREYLKNKVVTVLK